jgi:hypothetical protein
MMEQDAEGEEEVQATEEEKQEIIEEAVAEGKKEDSQDAE